MIRDISPPLSSDLAVWTGDTALSRRVLLDMKRGDSVTLSTLNATVHLGAHADGPSHYCKDAESIGERDLDYYLGPCDVIRAHVEHGQRVRSEDITGRVETERVLIATGTFPDPNEWNDDFAALSPALIDELNAKHVKLVGIDTPSVDLFDSKDLPAHKRILKHNMAVLEGLILAGVSEGTYELIALPLRLIGFDASPVRAVLRSVPANRHGGTS